MILSSSIIKCSPQVAELSLDMCDGTALITARFQVATTWNYGLLAGASVAQLSADPSQHISNQREKKQKQNPGALHE